MRSLRSVRVRQGMRRRHAHCSYRVRSSAVRAQTAYCFDGIQGDTGLVDALTTGIIWIAVGAALVILIHEQSVRLARLSRAQTRRREQLRKDIRDVCHDEECVALYESVAASIPDAVLYFALADTRRRMDFELNHEIAVVFADALQRVALAHDCRLRIRPPA